MHLYIEKKDFTKNYGLFTAIGIISALIVLCYILFHNPYKDIHDQIFEIASKTNNFYRERPGYWNLSTDSASEDGLTKDLSSELKKYDFTIGQGVDGSSGLPSNQTFDISLKNLGKSMCISLIEYKLTEQERLSLLKITVINENGETEFSWGAEHKLPTEKYAARNICSAKGNTVIWTFQ